MSCAEPGVLTRFWIIRGCEAVLRRALRWGAARVGCSLFATVGVAAEESARSPPAADVVVVGAGIAGLSAAVELGRGGANVAVVDMASVFGGHAVMAEGLLNLVDTPYQTEHGVRDSADLAYRDYMEWGEDADRAWVRYYVEHSREEVFDWLARLGVTFNGVFAPPGNRVARAHRVRGRGIALVGPIYREALRTPGVSFRWNVRLDRLLRSGERVTGVALTDLRTGEAVELEAKAVLLATGGFQSNLARVREAWPQALPFPPRVLAGAGINATGSGLEVARASGAAVSRLDHQWNYLSGLPDPRFPGTQRGVFAGVRSVWVNAEGRRFMAENASPKHGMPVLLRQTGATFWAIFDATARATFNVSGSDWADRRKVERLIVDNPAVVKRGETLDALAAEIGLPAAALKATIDRFNALVEAGVDEDFGRFGPGAGSPPARIAGPPYFAAQFFPITRKSMGGVVIDRSCRVLDGEGGIIAGLYAAGEVTGLAGINGSAGLEGTFLGPSLLTGRVAGRAMLAELDRAPAPPPVNLKPLEFRAVGPASAGDAQCMNCHALPEKIATPRPGFWHFEKVHRAVLDRSLACMDCHGEIVAEAAPGSAAHRIDRAAQLATCAACHRGE